MKDGIVVIQVWGVELTAVVETVPRTPEREALDAVVDELGPDELRVLTRIAEQLRMGAAFYGNLNLATDGRDFAKQTRAGAEDVLIHAACRWLTSGAGEAP